MHKRPVIAIIQARMGSERLPGKVLLDIEGQTMLERVVRRVQNAKSIDEVVVATTDRPADIVVIGEAERLGVKVVRGNEDDVLDRFRQAAVESNAETIVRVSADSPFVDPEVTDMVVDAFRSQDVDYASNKLNPSFPLGLDVEAFSRDALGNDLERSDGALRAIARYRANVFFDFGLASPSSYNDARPTRLAVDCRHAGGSGVCATGISPAWGRQRVFVA
jgi:spore coat polysaccharide biosynthesis protein SpsF (cytidylyltransferase family)